VTLAARGQPLCPQAGPARELQDVSGRVKVLQGGFYFGSVIEPPLVHLRTVVVAPAPKPPVVVLAGSFAVVVSLLGEEVIDIWHYACSGSFHSLAGLSIIGTL